MGATIINGCLVADWISPQSYKIQIWCPFSFDRGWNFLQNDKGSNRYSLKFSILYHEKQRYANFVFSKIQKKEQPKIFDDLNGTVKLRTIERWCKSFRETSSIDLKRSPGRPQTIRTKTTIRTVKRKMNRKIPLAAVKLEADMNLSETTVRRVLKKDLKLKL